jgi:uncharacterized repeat protein (TIGR01451 family)
MKNFYSFYRRIVFAGISLLAMTILGIQPLSSQVLKEFKPRTAQATPEKTIYNIKGDFNLVGNTNITLVNYFDEGNNGLTSLVRYVDIDGNPNTWNSSSATLQLSTENDAIPECSNILFAGLYWSGRGHDVTSPNVFTVYRETTGTTPQAVDFDYTVYYLDKIPYTTYTLSNSRYFDGSGTAPSYTLTSSAGSPARYFRFPNNATNSVLVSTNGSTFTTLPATITTVGNEKIAVLNTPYVVYSESGGITLTVTELIRNVSSTGDPGLYTSTSYIKGNVSGTSSKVVLSKTFNKRQVLIKGPGAANYSTVTANQNDIFYPQTDFGYMYSAYAEVTDYVKTHGIGEYFIADVASREGSGGPTGYYGGWGLVVVYENAKMNRRDVVVFDGHAYVAGNITADFTIPINGFFTSQSGPVNMKLGMMAGEGDRGISGDYFEILPLNNPANEWFRLNHAGNSLNNFFNSSMFTGGNPRNPNLLNNTGMDVSMFTIPNAGNTNIDNNQNSTTFRYGTTQDTYIIYMFAMAVDAYSPEPEGLNTIVQINGTPYTDGMEVQPGQNIQYRLEVRNKGTEPISNTSVVIPMPYTAGYVTSSPTFFYTPSGNSAPYFDPSAGATGSIIWEIGDLPLPDSPDDLLAVLSYTLKVTEECNILVAANCIISVIVDGTISGTGAISNVPVNNLPFIQGYEMDGQCQGEPILTPVEIVIDAADFVANNCMGVPPIPDFAFCNLPGNSIPITAISGGFPIGSRFYNEYPVDPLTSIEYTISNPFPATEGTVTYFAVPPGLTECYYIFTITVTTIHSVPIVGPDVLYCLDDVASALTATPSDPEYTLYYFTSETGGTPLLEIIPATDAVGETTYYVAEGISASCISPNRVPIKVIVTAIPAVPETTDQEFCEDESEEPYLASALEGHSLQWYAAAVGGEASLVTPVVDISVPGVYSVWVSQKLNAAPFCESPRVEVKITVKALPELDCPDELPVAVISDPLILLNEAMPSGGVYSGDGVVKVGEDYFFNPFVAGINVHTILYTYTDPETNCTNTCSILIEVIDIPEGDFQCPPTQTLCCHRMMPLNLSALMEDTAYPGGVFSMTETGIKLIGEEYFFDPDLAGAGSFSVTYTFTNAETGFSRDCSFDVIVQAVSEISLLKSANTPSYNVAGQVITYTIAVTNTGTVTVNDITVTDDKATITEGNPIATLEPGQTVNVTATYTVTQADLDGGSISNTASAEASDPVCGPISATSNELTLTADLQPAILLDKSANPKTYDAVGQVITYTFTVTNTGNLTLTNVKVDDPLTNSTNLAVTPSTLAPNESGTATATYTITQDDLDAGKVDNTATATGTPPEGDPVADNDSESITANQRPSIDIVKTGAPQTYNAVGDVITYSFTVTNTGNVTLTNVSVSDPLVGLSAITPAPVTLAPGASQVFTATYTITQADLDAGKVDNTATATGTPPAGDPVTDTDSESITADQNPAIDIVKTGAPQTYSAVDDVITYSFTVTNTGNVTLSNVSVSDPLVGLSAITPAPVTLAPGASQVFTATYTITQADLDAGKVDNTATATGTPPEGDPVTDTDSESITADQNPAIDIVKTAAPQTYSAVGDMITYSFTVTNTGNVTLSNVSVSDPLAGLSAITPAPVTLAPNASQVFTATYTITQADLDAGKVDNTATATGTPPEGDPVTDTDSESITANQRPSIEIVKAAAPQTYSAVDDLITYNFTVTNTGNVTLTNVSVSDPLAGLSAITPAPVTLAPGSSQVFTATYTISQADLDAGKVDNTATATGTPPAGDPVTDTDSESITANQLPAIEIVKAAAPQTYSAVDDLITYSFTVTNTGNVTLTNVSVSDPLVGLSAITPAPVTLAPGASQVFTATYTITQADLDAGKVDNTATATGTPPEGDPVTDTDSESITADQNPAIDIVKTAAPQTYSAVGDMITYSFTVTNTGNVTLSNVSVSDPLAGLSAITPAPVTLAPGSSQVFTATYTISQADLDAGKVDNTATATGTPPAGDPVTDTDSESITANQRPSIEIVKAAAPQTYSAVDDLITYNFTVTNTGNVTLTNVSVSDPLAGLSAITPAPVTLAPGASQVFTATYTITQADLDAGKVDNTATATGTPPAGDPVTDTDSESITANQLPSIEIVKTADPQTYSAVGDVITYSFTVTNTGNVTLSNVSVSDPLVGLSAITPAPVTLAPGASQVFTATYTITQADLDAGKVDNTATATGTPPEGDPVTDTDSESITANQRPAIDMVKAAAPQTYSAVGDLITYSFTVTNTGNVTLTNVSVSDPLAGLSAITPAPVTLAPGASQVFTATYTITQDDLDAGKVDNTATATGTPPAGDPVTDTDSESITADQNPAIDIVKAAAPQTYSAVGDLITYSFTVINTGNVTLTNVSVSDPLAGLSAITPAPVTLAPNASQVFTATYTITQADLDAGKVDNTATATGTPPAGDPVTDTDSESITADQNPAIDIVKTAAPQTYNAVGDLITYSFTVTNTGNVTLTNVSVSDPLVGLSAITPAPVTLAPGASQVFTATYTITQADLDAGKVDNTATATGTPPVGDPVTDTDSESITANQRPAIEIVKAAAPQTYSAVGDVITYNFTVTNTGNVTLTNVSVSDPLAGLSAITPAPVTLAPGSSQVFTATYTVKQTDLDAANISNTATASGMPPTGPAVTAIDDEIVTANQNPKVEIVKTVLPTSVSSPGLVTYNYLVTNTGNITLTGVAVDDDKLGPIVLGAVTLPPGASTSGTATYMVTQSDMDAGLAIVNVATVTSAEGATDTDDATVTIIREPAVTIEKTADKVTVTAAGQVITYNYVVTNTGNVTLTNVVVNDDKLGPIVLGAVTLAPGASTSGTATYMVTQVDMDAGLAIVNVATVTSAEGATDTDDATVTITREPAVTIEKTADKVTVTAAGQVITYNYVVENTGNVTLTNVVVNDDKLGPIVLGAVTLAPGASTSGTATYTVTQVDMDAGLAIVNVATVTSAEGATDTDDAMVTITREPSVAIEKTADVTTVTAAGQMITYTYVVENTGNVTLTNVAVNDDKLGAITLLATELAPGASTSGTATYMVTQSDMDAGLAIVNTATVTTAEGATDTDDATVTITREPSVTIEKTADKVTVTAAGQVITYNYVVENTGNVTLTNVAVNDDKLGAITLLATELAPGASTSGTATYTVTQSDMDAGLDIVNIATVTTTEGATDTDDATVTITREPSVTIEKTADVTTVTAAGQMIAYTYVVENTGNVTLTNVAVNDDKLGAITLLATELAPGESTSGTATYTVTQSDMDAGLAIVNTATVTTAEGASDTDDATVTITREPAVTIEKTADVTTVTAAGQEITYTYVVENTGNVTLTNVAVNDDKLGAITLLATELAPGASTSGTATYMVTQSDMNAGANIVNIATVTTTEGATDTDDATVAITQEPGINLIKKVNPKTYSFAGEVITYSLQVQNTGNVSLTNVTVNDPRIGFVGTVPGNLAPGATWTFVVAYTITQADMDAGMVENIATATGTPPAGDPVSDEDDETITANQLPAIGIIKSANPMTYDAVGDVITYTFTVTNTGNVTLTNVSVSDPLPGLSAITPVSVSLAPTQSQVFTATYTITQADLNAGEVKNTATATGTPPAGSNVSASDDEVITSIQRPGISVVKTALPLTYTAEGQVITYTITVTNTGNVTLYDVTVVDPLTGMSESIAEFAPGAVMIYNTTYTILPADMDKVSIINTVTATGKDPNGDPVSDDDSAEVVNDKPEDLVCPDDFEICLDADPVNLYALLPPTTRDDGTFSGPGVTSATGVFSPSLAGVGVHEITYSVVISGQGAPGLCSYSQGFWFASPVSVWPAEGVTVAGQTYTKTEAKKFFPPGPNPVRLAFTQVATLKLSGVDLDAFPDVKAAVKTIEDYLAPFGKLNPASLPSGNKAIQSAAGFIGDWVDDNHCDDEGSVTIVCTFEITVHALPVVECPEDKMGVSIGEDVFVLTGATPEGGIYSGPGVNKEGDNYEFNPFHAGLGVHEITYTYTDENGCTNFCTFEIEVIEIPPDDIPCPANREVCVDGSVINLTALVEDSLYPGGDFSGDGVSFDNDLSAWVFTPSAAGVGEQEIVYTFTASNGLVSTCAFFITVNALPVVECPESFTVCIASLPVVLSGGLPEGGVYSGTGVSFDGENYIFTETASAGVFTITYTYEDANECVNFCEFTITVEDVIDPVIVCPETLTLEGCDTDAITGLVYSEEKRIISLDDLIAAGGTASDDCGILEISYIDTKAGTCPIVVTRTFTVTDLGGNTATCTQIINVDDTTPPVWSQEMPDNITVECDAVPVPPTIVATDNCAGLTLTFSEVRTDGDCADSYTLTRTWTAVDNCENETVHVQVITVVDTTKPVWDQTMPADVTVECDAVPEVPEVITASDNCDIDVEVTFSEVRTDGDCADSYTLTRTWTAVDNCENETVHVQVITVVDTTKPVWDQTMPADVTVECDAVPEVPEVITASDNCDIDVEVTFSEVRTDGDCADSYTLTRTWTAVDNCENETVHVQVITVVDTTKPVWDQTMPADVTVECDAVPEVPEVITASDNCDIDVEVTFSEVRTDGDCADSYTLTRTWTAVDNCENETVHVQVITVVDTTKPVWDQTMPADVTVECDAVPEVPEVITASDNCDIDVEVTFSEVRTDGDCADSYTLTRIWTAVDNCENETVHVQVITVVDTTKPVWDQTMPADVTVECDAVPEVPEVITASDNCDIDVEVTFSEVRTDGDCADSYTLTRTWTAVDNCENETVHVQVITVVDTTKPVWDQTMPADVTVECDAVPEVPEVITASDNCDIDVEVTFSEVRTDGDCADSYTLTRTWTAVDNCENETVHVQVITVVDTTKPVWDQTMPADVTVECYAVPEVPEVITASDNCDIDVEVTFSEVRTDGDCADSYTLTRTWTAVDNCENETVHVQVITVVDTTKPVWDQTMPADVTVECDAVPEVPEVITASDNCDIDVEVTFSEVRTDGDCADSYTLTRTWTAVDNCENETVHVQVITVVDTTKPVWDQTMPADVTVECDAVPEVPEVITASDNCDIDVEVTFSEVRTDGDCADSYTLTRTWTAVDNCENETVHVQVITVVDTTKPVWDQTMPADVTVECDAVPEVPEVITASDNCDIDVEVTFSEVRTDGDCADSYTLTRTWTAVDNCENETVHVQVITVVDTTKPVWDQTMPADVTVECDAVPEVPEVITASDNCDIDVEVTFSEVRTDGDCADSYTLTRTWTAVDNCENETVHVQVITVVDTTAPVWNEEAGELDRNLSCDDADGLAAALALAPTATDNCSEEVSIALVSEETVPGECAGDYTIVRKWVATDDCENVSAEFVQTITVTDTKAPVIECPADPQIRIIPGDEEFYTAAEGEFDLLSAVDNCGTVTLVNNLNGLSSLDGYEFPLGETLVVWTATDDCGNAASCEFTVIVYAPSIKITKTANPLIYYHAGDAITYTITVENTGNVTLTNVVVSDPLTGFEETIPEFEPGAVEEFYTVYITTVPDVAAGKVVNTATATGKDPEDNDVSDSDDAEVTWQNECPPDMEVCLDADPIDLTELDKTAPSGGTFTGPGVSNNIFDPAAAGPGVHEITYQWLVPGTGSVCSYSQGYWFARPKTVWPYNVELGGFEYTQAEGKGFWPPNHPVKHAFTQYATIRLSGVDLSLAPDLAEKMQIIEDFFNSLGYKVTPQNLPSVPSNHPIRSASGFIGDWVDRNHCEDGTPPGEYDICVFYITVHALPIVDLGPDQVIMEGDEVTLDAGEGFASYLWSNGATTQTITVGAGTYSVTVTDENGCQGSDEVVISLFVADPKVTITKDADVEIFTSLGDVINYVVVVTNTGNVPLTNVSVSDPLTGLSEIISELGVGDAESFMTPYTIKAQDMVNKEVMNIATASFVYESMPYTVSAGAIVTLQQLISFEFCSLSQGFYGNSGGKFCDGTGTFALINRLLMENGGMVIGVPANNRTFTIPATGAQCVINLLPSGGNSSVIPGNRGCGNTSGMVLGNGRLKNVLLGQTITLQLNLWLSPNLGALNLENRVFYTAKSSGCGEGEGNVPVGSFKKYTLPNSVWNYLAVNGEMSIQSLFTLANQSLGGVKGLPSMGDINNAISIINEAFVECRILSYDGQVAPTEPGEGEEEAAPKVSMVITPNPFNEDTEIVINFTEEMNVVVEVFNMSGTRVATMHDGRVFADYSYRFRFGLNKTDGQQTFLVVVRTPYGVTTSKALYIRQ